MERKLWTSLQVALVIVVVVAAAATSIRHMEMASEK